MIHLTETDVESLWLPLELGALTAVTAGAGIARSMGSILRACCGSTKNRHDIDLLYKNLKKMIIYGSKFKANLKTNSML